MNFFFWLLFGLLFFVCVILILLILIQKGRGGGLSGAFGGGGGGSTAFGSKTGDVLTWATSILFGVFMILAIGVNLVANKRQANWNEKAGVQPPASQMPATPATPAK